MTAAWVSAGKADCRVNTVSVNDEDWNLLRLLGFDLGRAAIFYERRESERCPKDQF